MFLKKKPKKQKKTQKNYRTFPIYEGLLNLKHHFEEHRTFSMFAQFLTMIKKFTKHHANDTSNDIHRPPLA